MAGTVMKCWTAVVARPQIVAKVDDFWNSLIVIADFAIGSLVPMTS
jgi:hypothetical protein